MYSYWLKKTTSWMILSVPWKLWKILKWGTPFYKYYGDFDFHSYSVYCNYICLKKRHLAPAVDKMFLFRSTLLLTNRVMTLGLHHWYALRTYFSSNNRCLLACVKRPSEITEARTYPVTMIIAEKLTAKMTKSLTGIWGPIARVRLDPAESRFKNKRWHNNVVTSHAAVRKFSLKRFGFDSLWLTSDEPDWLALYNKCIWLVNLIVAVVKVKIWTSPLGMFWYNTAR